MRRGLYWRGRRTRFGVMGAPAVEAVRKLVSADEALGAAGWYATNLRSFDPDVPVRPDGCDVPGSHGPQKSVRVVDRSNRTERRAANPTRQRLPT